MPREGTKAAKIMALHRQRLSIRAIAERIPCRPEYVRVVVRQRKGAGSSDIDNRYRKSSRGSAKIKQWARARQPAKRAYARALKETGSYEKARRAYAAAISEAARA